MSSGECILQFLRTFCGFIFILWDLITIPMQLFDIPGFSGLQGKQVQLLLPGFLDLMSEITFAYWCCDLFLQFIFSFERQGQRYASKS